MTMNKVSGDYEALNDRLRTLPDQLSYDVMVPFGPLAFMPGKLVHTNEVTVLLGDNWFAKCSAKQAQKIVDHRVKYVKGELDDLLKTRKNFDARVGFTEDLEKISNKGNYVDIREEVGSKDTVVTKGKHRLAHKHNSKPKLDTVLDLEEVEEEGKGGEGNEPYEPYSKILSEDELWARLDKLEKLEEEHDEEDRLSDTGDNHREDSTTSSSSSSSEEEKEADGSQPEKGPGPKTSWAAPGPANDRLNGMAMPAGDALPAEDEDKEDEDGDCLPTIYFSHTVRINTGKNTTLKFSERKEHSLTHSKKKKKNGTNGQAHHGHHELHKISSPVDIYRLFVDVKNGEPVPRKSILKSRSRENSVCSDTSESSATDFEERRLVMGRSLSHDEAPQHSDASDGLTEEDSPPPHHPSRFQRKQQEEVATEAPPAEPPKRVSKFKAARLQ
ncbi:hypothetical protein CRUP_026326, partial [Coryphaenoides rupestris]